MLSVVFIIIVIIYLLLIGWLNYGFNTVENFKLQDLKPKTTFSIIIPFRNEAKALPALLDSILKLNYDVSKFEIILVDDASDDNSVEVIKKYISLKLSKKRFVKAQYDIKTIASTSLSEQPNISIVKNKRSSNSPKKDAISTAISQAKNDWIITTDADCILPKYWLDCYDEFIQMHDTIAVAGPVKFVGKSSFFNRFQIIDALSLQGATVGSFGIKKPILCNGANFGYKKSIFNSVNGFQNNDTIASGDDIFLLEKFLKHHKNKVHYLKSDKAIVTTSVTKNTTEYINQRLRWGSKTSHYKSLFPKAVGLSIFCANLVLALLIPLVIFNLIALKTAILLFLIKFSIDLLIIFKTARFFKQEAVLLSYVFVSLIYPFLNTYIVLLMPFKSYSWKGRNFKH